MSARSTSALPAGQFAHVLCVTVCLLLASVARTVAQTPAAPVTPGPHAVQAERPTVATHAFTVAPGWVEVEAGAQRQSMGAGASDVAVPVLFKIGLGSRVQLDLAPGWQRTAADGTSLAGPTDVFVGLKWRVADDLPLLGAFAVQSLVSLQTGSVDKGTGSGETSVSLLAISSHTFGPVAVDASVGYTRTTGDGSVVPTHAGVWCLSAGFPIAGSLGAVTELFGTPATSGPAGEPATVAFLVGPTLTLAPQLMLDAGVILNIHGFGDPAIYGGLTWNIGRAWRQH